ncbi:MAG: hypothetical protein GF333_04080 [Candidatus Omnitrophica bacterium]|nr:hypothetical protein [Candidatus Omnitrophota bacterium]
MGEERKMQPAGPLMREHRLIERVVGLVEEELARLREERRADRAFALKVVDFFRVYADWCHHGKEEDILFSALKSKPLSEEHRSMREELLGDHVRGRQLVSTLEKQASGSEEDQTGAIETTCRELVKLYRDHIHKEDDLFFLPCMEYFSREEKDQMILKFWEFDRSMIHRQYQITVSGLEKERRAYAGE